MIKLRNMSFRVQLTLWLGLSLFVVGSIMAVGNYLVSTLPHERRFYARADRAGAELARALREQVWNMDDRSLATYFSNHPWQLSSIAGVRVLTEFGDPIYETRISDAAHVRTFKHAVTYEGRTIGYIETVVSTAELQLIRAAIARSGVLIVLSGLMVIFFVAVVLTRTIIGHPVEHLLDALTRIEQGEYDIALPRGSSREIEAIFRNVRVMARRIAERTEALQAENSQRRKVEDDLRALTGSLEQQVRERTQALETAYRDLQQEAEERRQVQQEILAISDRERQRIGRDLHDSLGQKLTGMALLVSVLRRLLETEGHPTAKDAVALGDQMKSSIAETRSISHGLMPLNLQDGGVVSAIKKLAAEAEHMYGFRCPIHVAPGFSIEDDTVAINIYRIIQEAIHNAHRHGGAKQIDVSIEPCDAGSAEGHVIIRDNGKGFDNTTPSSDGMGMRIMRYRAAMIGGEMTVTTNEAGGATIRVTFQDKPPPVNADGEPPYPA